MVELSLRLPTWELSTAHIARSSSDERAGIWRRRRAAAAARAGVSGAMLAAAALYVWPAASSSKVARARGGALAGLAAVAACELAAVGLCAGTSYCLPA